MGRKKFKYLITVSILITILFSGHGVSAPLEKTKITANKIEAKDNNSFEMSGAVSITQQDKVISAEKCSYNKSTGESSFSEEVSFTTLDAFRIDCESGQFNINTEKGKFYNSQYKIFPPKNDPNKLELQGRADIINVSDRNSMALKSATYSTCPKNTEDWTIKSSKINLDRESGNGNAINARLEFFNVPIFYTPYIGFPIGSARKSGLLFPYIAYDDISGIDITIPYYFNLAPNYDLTSAPRIIGRRGVGLESEFRFLSENQQGTLLLNFFPEDDIYGESRHFSSYNQSGTIFKSSSLPISNSIELKNVSDKDYFSDLDDSSKYSDESHLFSRINLSTSVSNFQLGISAEGYQTLDEDVTKPFRKLPELSVGYSNNSSWLSHKVNMLVTKFDHDEDMHDTGSRLSFDYKVSYDKRSLSYFFEPGILLRHRHYSLDNGETYSVSAPTLFIDSGIFLERDFILGEKQLLQTLEPRLFIVDTEYDDQSDIPNYDSSENGFGVSQLFSIDRFSGNDRVGDTQKVSASITSRLFNNSNGYEYGNITIGEIFYLDERKTRLSNPSSPLIQPNSNLVASLESNFHRNFSAITDIEYNHKDSFVQTGRFSAQYKDENLNIFNASYQVEKASEAQITDEYSSFSSSIHLNNKFNIWGKVEYSIFHHHTRETFLGLKYKTCCWSVSIASHRYIDDMTKLDDVSSGVKLQLVFFGLSGVGKDLDSLAAEEIPGFESTITK